MNKILAAFVAAIALLFALVVPANAHDELVSTDPADGAVLETAPTQITLTFSANLTETVSDQDNMVSVVDSNATEWVNGPVTVSGTTLVASLAADMPVGGYAVQWRAVSSDGHPLSGSLSFSVGTEVVVMPLTTDGDQIATTQGEEVPIEMRNDAATTASSGMPVWLAVLASAAAGAVVLAAWLLYSRIRTRASRS